MKKLSFTLLMTLGLFMAMFTACEDDEPTPDPIPTITSLTPNSGPVGATVTIAGTNFGTSPTVSFGGTSATVTSPSNTSLTVTVPASLAAGAVQVTVTADGQTSAASTFTVTDESVPTIADLAGDTGNLSVLLAALGRDAASDLLAAAADEDATLTVFAPTDAAFDAFLDANGLSSLDNVPDDLLVAVLQDHILGSVVASTAIENGQIAEALSGNSLLFTANDDGVFVNNAQVTTADVTAANGVVHIVDAVIIGAMIPEGDLAPWVSGHLQFNNNMVADPELGGISRTANQALNPVPSADAVTSGLAAYPTDDFFTEVTFKGAFDPAASGTWMDNWSTLWKLGYLVGSSAIPEAPYNPATATIETLPNSITEDLTLTSDKVWKMDGLVYVESGTLTIQPGTVIIAETQPTSDNTSALVITTGAQIDAQGTEEAPIIFTSEDDDGTKEPSESGDWGGIILLGEAPVGFGTAGTNSIEGIDPNEPRGQYGGTDAADDSGIMTYVSIRYSGVGIEPGSEIQGLSLGGVGNGTTLEYIDIFSSGDDGIEFFGGTVDVKYAITAFVDDDNFDYDYGWSGNGQFWFSIQTETLPNADHGGEWDGADPDNAEPFSNPTLYNLTLIGLGQDAAIRDVTAPAILMRDNTGGTLANSIITDFNGKGIEVENLADTDGDSYNRLINRNLMLLNNVWNVNLDYTDLNAAEGNGIVYPTGGY